MHWQGRTPGATGTENSLFGAPNNPGFQFGGWNVGTEGVVRTTYGPVFLELGGKLDYAWYSGIHVSGGNASMSFGTAEFIWSIGGSIPVGRRVAP